MSLRNESGMSLISVMIGSAISIIVAYAISSTMATLSSSNKGLDERAQLANFAIDVKNILGRDSSCKASLKSFDYSNVMTAGTPVPVNFNLKKNDLALAAYTIAANEEVSRGLIIEAATMKDVTPLNMSGAKIAAGNTTETYQKRTALLEIKLKKTDKNKSQGPIFFKPIVVTLHLVTNLGGIVQSCTYENPEISACLETGGDWDNTKPEGSKCKPTKFCRTLGSYLAPPAPNPFKNPFTGGYNCPTDSAAYHSSRLSVATSCGKYCVQNQNYDIMQCLTCGDDFVGSNPTTPPTSPKQQAFDADVEEKIKTAVEELYLPPINF